MDRVPGWKQVGLEISNIIEEMVEQHQPTLELVLARLGDKLIPAVVPEALCVELRSRLVSVFQMSDSAVNPGPCGFFPGLVQAPTDAAQDPDVHIHKWLRVPWTLQCPSRQAEFSLWCLRKASAKSETESST